MRSLITIPKDLFQQFRSPASSNSLVAGPVASKEAKLISKVGTAVDQTGRCGCISQFQVNVDTMGTILSTTAATKKIVLGSDRLPFKTTNGKLMLSECSCQVNNKISSILAKRFTGMPLEYAANEVFSPAATPEFLRTLLRNLGLPAKHAHCLRLVEAAAAEALTGTPRAVVSAAAAAAPAPPPAAWPHPHPPDHHHDRRPADLSGSPYRYDVGALSMDPDDMEYCCDGGGGTEDRDHEHSSEPNYYIDENDKNNKYGSV